jgi:hypothetical protein
MKIPKEGETVEVEGWGKGVVTGRPSPEGRYRVRLPDGTSVGVGGEPKTTGNPKTDEAVQEAVTRALDARGLRIEPGFPGYAAVGPGDNNAGDPLFTGPRDQPLKEQPLDDTSAAPGETPEEVAEDVIETRDTKEQKERLKRQQDQTAETREQRSQAQALTQASPATRDKALRGPRE